MSEFKVSERAAKGLEGEQGVNHDGEAIMEVSSHSGVRDEKRAGLAVDVSAERDEGGYAEQTEENIIRKQRWQLDKALSMIEGIWLIKLVGKLMKEQSSHDQWKGGPPDSSNNSCPTTW